MTDAPQRSVLITGCSSGIGLATARMLRERGYRVFATARKAGDVAKLQDDGYESLRLDLDDSDSIREAVDEILLRTTGTLYGLFNNGAYGQPGAVEDLKRHVLRAQFETNLFGTLELTNRVIPVMRRQGYGRIIMNSSVLGFAAMPMRGAYNASKFALEGLSDTLRQELHGTGIHVVLVEPGPIETRFRANSLKKFIENIDIDASRYREQYLRTLERLKTEGPAVPFTLPPEAVARKVVLALEKRRPKPRYYVTVPTYLFGYLKRILGTRAMDAILRRV